MRRALLTVLLFLPIALPLLLPAPDPAQGVHAALRHALRDPDRGVRYAAVIALGKAGADPAVPVLTRHWPAVRAWVAARQLDTPVQVQHDLLWRTRGGDADARRLRVEPHPLPGTDRSPLR